MSNNKQQGGVEWLAEQIECFGNKHELQMSWTTLDELIEQAKEMEKEQELRLIKFTSEIFELGKSHFSYVLITNEEILELYNETNGTNNEGNSK